DDTFTVSISGPLGAVTYLVASVNMAGASLPPVISFAGFDVDQYGGPRHTGWRQPDASAWDCLEANACQLLTPSLDISTLGSPLSITFTVSDVNDDQFTTIVTLDNIHF